MWGFRNQQEGILPSLIHSGRLPVGFKGEPAVIRHQRKNTVQKLQGRHLDQEPGKPQLWGPRETPDQSLGKPQSRWPRGTPSKGTKLGYRGKRIHESQSEESEEDCYLVHVANNWPPHGRGIANQYRIHNTRKTLESEIMPKIWGIYTEEEKVWFFFLSHLFGFFSVWTTPIHNSILLFINKD